MKLFYTFIFIIRVNVLCVLINTELQQNIEYLTEIFFANLEKNPVFINDNIFNESSKAFIDRQVSNYIKLIKQTYELNDHSLNKRSSPFQKDEALPIDEIGVYILEEFVEKINIKAKHIKDVTFFQQEIENNNVWYSAIIENSKNSTESDDVVIYKLNNSTYQFTEVKRTSFQSGIKLAVHSLLSSTYIIVSKSNNNIDKFSNGTTILEFAPKESLSKIQTLNTNNVTHVALWERQQDLFMIILESKEYNNTNDNYPIQIPIYQWLGKHFDVVSYITTYGAKSIRYFKINSVQYIAVANFNDKYGNTKAYSEIFKYNLGIKKYELNQRILSNAAMDVQHFSFKKGHESEHFLVFANMFEKEYNGIINYETNSIVYKYVDEYFIPFQTFKLNGAIKWLPVHGINGEFLLIVASKFEGIKIFQYDGWQFTESSIQYSNEPFAKNIVSMYSFIINEKPVVVITNEHNMRIFEVNFAHKKMLDEFYSDMMNWCEKSLKEFQYVNASRFTRKVDEKVYHNKSFESLELMEPETFNDENFIATDVDDCQNIKCMQKILVSYADELKEMENQTETLLQTSNKNIINGDVFVEKLIFSGNSTYLENITVETVNGIGINNILDNIININDGFEIKKSLMMKNTTIENAFDPKYINNHSVHQLIHTNRQNSLNDVIVLGDIVFLDGIFVKGKLNNISFTKENILLRKENQTFETFEITNVTVEKLDNSLNNNILQSQNIGNDRKIIIQNITNLTVKKATIFGLMNKMDLQSLDKYALKSHGVQNIVGKYSFGSISISNLNVTTLSGKQIPKDLVFINGNEKYYIEESMLFPGNISLNNLTVRSYLNNIRAFNGKLDVLLSESNDVQHIIGQKNITNITLNSPFKLQTRINNSIFEKINPIRNVNEEIILNGDYVIQGNTTINKLLQVKDMKSNNSKYSVQNLQQYGIKLNDASIPLQLNFLKPFKTNEVFTDTLNGFEVNSFLVMGLNKLQIVTGRKIFRGDVRITGPSTIENVNGINIPNLDKVTLKISGNQTLVGNYRFDKLFANRISNTRTQFQSNLWKTVMTLNQDQIINGTTVIQAPVTAKRIESKTIQCNSLINGMNFTDMVTDSIFYGQKQKIMGHKIFTDLNIENLEAGNIDLDELQYAIEELQEVFELEANTDFPDDINVENITFVDKFNDIPSASFGNQWLSNLDGELIKSNQTFKKIIIIGNCFIPSGLINNISIKDIAENSIKLDEDFEFETITFRNGLSSLSTVKLDGMFESLDIHDIVQSNIKAEQVLRDQIIFNENVYVTGRINFGGLISGFNLSELCNFGINSFPKNLTVNGNVFFAKGPELHYINNQPINNILENVWFNNKDTLITGNVDLNQAEFQDKLQVHGFVDNFEIQLIAQTYFSKTREQNITAILEFDDMVTFQEDLYADKAIITEINGINLEEFVSTAILNEYSQFFENTVYLNDCEIKDLQGTYLVNSLNLQTDVMQYNKVNIVTGKKIINNINVNTMTIKKNIKIQDIDILRWLQSSVLKKGVFQIPGKITFLNETTFVNGISCSNLVNGFKFNVKSVLLSSVPQTISGKKTFIGNKGTQLRIRLLQLGGLLNGIYMPNLTNFQVYDNRDIVFGSPIYVMGVIETANVNAEKLYHGLNLTQLIQNITHSTAVYGNNVIYENMLNTSLEIKNSLKEKAYFLDHYNVRQIYKSVDIIVPVHLNNNNNDQYLACVTKGLNNYSVQFGRLNSEDEPFKMDDPIIPVESTLHYMKPILFRQKESWYIEHKRSTSSFYEGSIFDVTTNELIPLIRPIVHSGSKSVHSITFPGTEKQCIALLFTQKAVIYCESKTDNDVHRLSNYQELISWKTVKMTTLEDNSTSYIFIINKDGMEQSYIVIWIYNQHTEYFEKHQIIYYENPISITASSYKNNYYLAITSGHLTEANYKGVIDIRIMDTHLKRFYKWQNVDVNAPIQAEFAILPSNELVLYVITDDPSSPLIVYVYEGIFQFQRKIVTTTVSKILNLQTLTTLDFKHYILVQNLNESLVIQAAFKGERLI